ncbi:hypothetical protein ACFZBP_26065 [Streptomyces sp. NPDC008086]|uniref:hypothetical protein n=1 Tax=Streptomyces sp. NPDC008086 TaxID=3364807 RepID=UPI0036DFA8F5
MSEAEDEFGLVALGAVQVPVAGGVLGATADAAPDAWRRLVAWMIQSFQAPARGPLPDPPEDAALYEAMRRTSQDVNQLETGKRG